MRIVVAVDSFKGSLTSVEAGKAIQAGILQVCKDADVLICPIADGGEGTVEALVQGMNGSFRQTEVTGPLGESVLAQWGIIAGKVAVIEMAAAAGLTLVEEEKRNPLYTTTYGVGELIRAAIREGCRHFIIGIGGSATNDGGVGMLEALGFDFCGEEGQHISRGAIGLSKLKTIAYDGVDPALKDCTFRIVCDVQNPLCGANGCSRVFAPQKGASEEQIEQMDQWLMKYAEIAGGDPNQPGAGAAGGLGFAFSAFTNARLERGIDIIMEETGLEEKIRNADLVITGEGKIDAQTFMGKVPEGVAAMAKKYGKRVIAFCGIATKEASACKIHGIDAVYPTKPEGMSLPEAMEKTQAAENLTKTAEKVFAEILSAG